MLSISTLDNKFSDLFAALFIPTVLNIQNLKLHMLTDLTHQRFHWGIFHMASTIYTLCRLSCYVINFVTNKKLTFCASFYSKSLHSPLCSVTGIYMCSQRKDKMINKQPGTWSFGDTFRTAQKTEAMIHWMLHFWDTSDALESPKSSLVSFQFVRFFNTRFKEDL